MDIILTFPCNDDMLKENVNALHEKLRQAEVDVSQLRMGIDHYQRLCTHAKKESHYDENTQENYTKCVICGKIEVTAF